MPATAYGPTLTFGPPSARTILTVDVTPLNGLGDFAELAAFLEAAKATTAPTTSVQTALKVSHQDAMDTLRLMQVTTSGDIKPTDIISKSGAEAIGVAGRKAQDAARLHHGRATMLERKAKATAASARLEKDAKRRVMLEAQAGALTKELLSERAKSQRAVTVAGATLAALKFRNEAQRVTDPAKKALLMNQAAAAVAAGKVAARTRVQMKLPTTTPPVLDKSATLSGYSGGLGEIDWSSILGTVTSAAQQVFPANNVVGAALRGDWSTAAASAVNIVGGIIGPRQPAQAPQPPAYPMYQQPQAPLSPPMQAVQQQIAMSMGQVAPSGMRLPFGSSLPGWAIPAALGGGLLILTLLFI
jgi:hypothetical protein